MPPTKPSGPNENMIYLFRPSFMRLHAPKPLSSDAYSKWFVLTLHLRGP